MATITITYDARNTLVKKVLSILFDLGVKVSEKEEESPYDKKFVDKVLKSRNSKGKQIKIEDLRK